MFVRIAAWFVEVQMPDKGCQGHWEFRQETGNAGTGMYQRGAQEQGCDFAPVAGTETTKKQIPDTTYTLIPHPVLADYTDAIQKDKL